MYLSPESSSTPGRWKTSTVEAARGPMLEATNPRTKVITVMACTQLMKTSIINNIVGFHIHQDPAPIIVMQPTKSLAETWSKERFDKMVRDTPVLNEAVRVKRKGDLDNTLWNKVFPGGQLNIIGANSPSELASRPVRIVLCDEVDKYPQSAGKEGDPIKLITERTATFWNSLLVHVCSPTVEGLSRIEKEFERGDMRYYHGKCPHCNEYEKLEWSQVHYDESDVDGSTAYRCSHCDVLWSELDRLNAIREGKYIATKPFDGHASFHANKLASPWEPLSVLVRKYLDAKGNHEELKTFYNTQLAQTYKTQGESPDYMRLYERRENYGTNNVPSRVGFLSCGVDVQGNRLELEIVGWGRNKESWSIDYRVIPGHTGSPEVWQELTKVLNETWTAKDGRELQIRMMCVDSGFNTQHVYNWVRSQSASKVRAIKGIDHLQMVFGKPTDVELNLKGKRIRNATQVWPVGVSVIKADLYAVLKMDSPIEGNEQPGYCHFPEYDVNYFQGLCSEQFTLKKLAGKDVLYWEKVFERNEPLDTRVYARAAAAMFGMDRFQPTEWEVLFNTYDFRTKNAIVEDYDEYEDGDHRGRKLW